MFIHVSRRQKFSDEYFTSLLRSSWDRAAVYYYQRFYDDIGHSEDEHKILDGWKARLEVSVPEKFKTGYHLLEKGGAYIGQDIIVANGKITHTCLAVCKKSNGALLKISRHRWHCIACGGNHGKGMVRTG